MSREATCAIFTVGCAYVSHEQQRALMGVNKRTSRGTCRRTSGCSRRPLRWPWPCGGRCCGRPAGSHSARTLPKSARQGSHLSTALGSTMCSAHLVQADDVAVAGQLACDKVPRLLQLGPVACVLHPASQASPPAAGASRQLHRCRGAHSPLPAEDGLLLQLPHLVHTAGQILEPGLCTPDPACLAPHLWAVVPGGRRRGSLNTTEVSLTQ